MLVAQIVQKEQYTRKAFGDTSVLNAVFVATKWTRYQEITYGNTTTTQTRKAKQKYYGYKEMRINEYLIYPCDYCEEYTMRNKLHTDFRLGEKGGKGYYPELFYYYICDNCKRSSIRYKHWKKLHKREQ